jgi:antirestriction protein ArdC
MVSAYEKITDQIIEIIEKTQNLPWEKPWNTSNATPSGSTMFQIPKNLITKKEYKGSNLFMLAFMAQYRGFQSPFWLTFNQAKSIKGFVKAGEKATAIVFWGKKTYTTEKENENEGDDSEEEEHSFLYCKQYYVFNSEQCNLPADKMPKIEKMPEIALEKTENGFVPIEAGEKIAAGYKTIPEIRFTEPAAFYNPGLDYINLPKKECFKGSEEYYSTLFHECAHSTGHSSRLNRKGVTQVSFFGGHDYSQEELVAELTACFLCAESGMLYKTQRNSAAYIKHWLTALRNNKKMLVIAAQQAEKAANYILNR